MNEATLKGNLMAALKATMPGGVGFRHEDKFRGGISDISWTWAGTTSWIEVKYERVGRRSPLTALQAATLAALARAGAPAYALTYHETRTARETILVRFMEDGTTRAVMQYAHAHKWGHGDVAAAVRGEHEQRAEDAGWSVQ